VAVFCAYFFLTLFYAADFPPDVKSLFTNPVHLGKITLIFTLAVPALLLQPYSLLSRTLLNKTYNYEQTGLTHRKVFELSGEEMSKLAQFSQLRCPPQKTMIAPPYYAYIAERKLSQNSSSLFILFHAYFSDWKKFQAEFPGKYKQLSQKEFNIAFSQNNWDTTYYNSNEVSELSVQFSRNTELKERYPAIALFLDMREDILQKRTGLILVNQRHMFFWIPPLHQAIRDYCRPVQPALNLPNREEAIVAYVQK